MAGEQETDEHRKATSEIETTEQLHEPVSVKTEPTIEIDKNTSRHKKRNEDEAEAVDELPQEDHGGEGAAWPLGPEGGTRGGDRRRVTGGYVARPQPVHGKERLKLPVGSSPSPPGLLRRIATREAPSPARRPFSSPKQPTLVPSSVSGSPRLSSKSSYSAVPMAGLPLVGAVCGLCLGGPVVGPSSPPPGVVGRHEAGRRGGGGGESPGLRRGHRHQRAGGHRPRHPPASPQGVHRLPLHREARGVRLLPEEGCQGSQHQLWLPKDLSKGLPPTSKELPCTPRLPQEGQPYTKKVEPGSEEVEPGPEAQDSPPALQGGPPGPPTQTPVTHISTCNFHLIYICTTKAQSRPVRLLDTLEVAAVSLCSFL